MMRYFAVLVAIAAAQTSFAEEPKVGQRWALLIGVDDYAYAQKLKYCGADQLALSKRLIAADFPADQVFVLHDKAENSRFRPSLGNIERQLSLVLNLADADDLVVIAFSGHGVHIAGKSYLCPAECTLDDPKTLIAVDDVYDRLKECAASFKLVLVDACRNDPRPEGSRSMTAVDGTRALARTLQEMELPQGVVLLNSCAPGEFSWEDEKLGHGVFMHFVLDGLDGAADTGADGSVSLNELQTYAGNRTKAYVANRHAVAQRPFFKGDLTTEALEYALLPVKSSAGRDLVRPRDFVPDPHTNSLGMRFALVPAGEFNMGSPLYDLDAEADERPQHSVRITQPFLLGIHEVTRAQFGRFVAAANYRTEAERDGRGGFSADHNGKWEQKPEFVWRTPGIPQQDDHPVVQVSWNDAIAFCEWLGASEGTRYRLPSEAEWEYACRAGTRTVYYNGDRPDNLTAIGNVADRSFKSRRPLGFEWGIDADDGNVFTAPVGRYTANAFGLHDMTGNVWEWCQDRSSRTYTADPVTDPIGPNTGNLPVMRGGSWDYPPATNRPADRSFGTTDYRSHFIGFRVVKQQ